ncbi:MAG: C25 family cysteine peptidase [candidate division KSB1 bacterium]|nr:C25 family cysteine peptidase [candidate division KSB1 bacterium]
MDLIFDSLSVTQRVRDGNVVGSISIPQCRTLYTPGFPEVPADHLLLGIPPTGTPGLEIVSQHIETRQIPMPLIDDEHVLSFSNRESDWFPARIAELGEPAVMRNQRVVPVRLYPVRYQKSTQMLQVVRSLRLRIRFDGATSSMGALSAETAFEPVYRTLLDNFESSRPWRLSGKPQGAGLAKTGAKDAYDHPRYKIELYKDGVYGITGRELADAGADITQIDPNTITLSNRGEQIPVLVLGKGDRALNYNDRIVFIGEHNRGDYSYNSYYSDTNVYVLSWGQSNAQRFAKVLCIPEGTETDTLNASETTLHLEQDVQYRRLVGYDDPTQDHWFWQRFEDGASYDVNVNLPAVNNAFPLYVRAGFYGVTSSSEAEVDHHVVVYLGGTRLGDAYADGMVPFEYKSPQSLVPDLTDTSTVRFEMPGDLDVPADHVYFNWVAVDYTQNHTARNGLLKLKLSNTDQVVQAKGFSNDNVLMLSKDGRHFVQPEVRHTQEGYAYCFKQSSLVSTTLYMIETDRLKSVKTIRKDDPSDLKQPGQVADYVIISHMDFADQARRLADFRTSQGYQAMVVDIEDVYDEFSDGLYDPRAIRRFLKYAYENWSVSPLYVLLMGDTTYEMDKWLHKPDIRPSYVPSMMQYTKTFGFTSSDNYFVAVAGEDILPDMYIGRLPVASVENAEHMVQKIIDYETQGDVKEWRRNICLATGDEDFFDLCGQHAAENVIPDRYIVNWASTRYSSPYYSTTEDLINWINSGQSVITFIVHGASEQIADKRLLHVDDMPRLTNQNRYPFGIALSCYLSHFDHPTDESFGEKLLIAKDKGLLALFGSVGKSYQYIDYYMNESLFNTICSSSATTLGEIVNRVKYDLLATSSEFWEPIVNYVLLGDPASNLQLTRDLIDLTFSDKVLASGETLTVSGSIKNAAAGTVYCSLWTLSDSLIRTRSFPVTNGRFSGNLVTYSSALASKLNRHEGIGVVRAYFSDGNRDAAGAERFGLAKPLVDSVYTLPRYPQIGDSVHMVLNIDPGVVEEVNGIESVELQWSLNEQNWNLVEMMWNEDAWITREPVVQEYSRPVYYRLEIVSGNGNTTLTDVYSYRVNRHPDLRISGDVSLVQKEEGTCLRVPLENVGESACSEFGIKVLKGLDTRVANRWIENYRVRHMPAARDSVIYIPTPQVEPGGLNLVFILDADNEIKEERESNNVSTAQLLLATPEQGTAGQHFWPGRNIAVEMAPGVLSRTASLHLTLVGNDTLLRSAEQAMLQPLNGTDGKKMIYHIKVGEETRNLNGDFSISARVGNLDSRQTADIRWFAWNERRNGWQGLQTEQKDSLVKADCPANCRRFGLMLSRDNQGPRIHVGVEGQNFANGDLVNRHPTFTLLLKDSSGIHVDPSQLSVFLDGQKVADENIGISIERESQKTALLTYSPDISSGSHQLRIEGTDVVGNTTVKQVQFNVASEFSLEFLANHPNPFYEETTFAFLLTDMASRVSLKVFTVSGKRIRTFERIDISGYQEIAWDGRDEWGNELANGVYYLKFTAVQGGKRIERIVKLAKLR